MAELAAAQNLLHSVFGFASFRPGQGEIVETIAAGRDVLAVMPTGSGKSLCYQLPALMRDGLTVVVSPLIALMRNQVAQLRGYGIAAASLNSSNDYVENQRILGDNKTILLLSSHRDLFDLLFKPPKPENGLPGPPPAAVSKKPSMKEGAP